MFPRCRRSTLTPIGWPACDHGKCWIMVPKILEITRTTISPWIDVIVRQVQFAQGRPAETYYSIGQPDYVVVLALTPAEELLLVRQYRPAIERFSLELPAGFREPNEAPIDTASRELLEETGYPAVLIEPIGSAATCSSRISNSTLSFFARTGERSRDFVQESGVSVVAIPLDAVRDLVMWGDFSEQTHLGVLMQAVIRGLIRL
jgi:ADP-ribose pyrophosphatase